MDTEDKKLSKNGNEKKLVPGGEKGLVFGEGKPGIEITPELKVLVSATVKEEIQKEIKYDKASLFTVFGIFASIVTFVSVEIQILKILCDVWNVIGFSIIILASLITFILILDYIGRGWRNDFKLEIKQFPWILTSFILLLFAVGFFSIRSSNKEIACKDEAIFKKYESSFIDKQIEIENEYGNKIDNLQKEINNNRKVIEDLQKSQSLKNQ